MLRRNLVRRTTGAAEHDRNIELTAGHVEHLCGRVDDLVGGQDREVERHEFDDWSETSHRRAHTQPGESKFSNRSVDDTLWSELFQQSTRVFVRALTLGNFLAHEEDRIVARE